MTATMERTELWQTRPGWGIAVDLTPVEIVNTRKVRSLKKQIIAGLALVVLLCVGATFMTFLAKIDAEDSHDAAQAATADLQARAAKYADITAMQTAITQVDAQVSTLMTNDVDVVNLIARIRAALPPRVTIDNASVALAQEAPVDPAAAPVAPGEKVIGSVTLSGSGSAIRDLAPFVAALIRLKGVVDVVPTSTSKTEDGVTYTLSLNFTDALYTHRFDAKVAQ